MKNNTPTKGKDSKSDFGESTTKASDLPDGWVEVYHSRRNLTHGNETYELVKALYEHVPTALKVAVYPEESIQIEGKPTHQIISIIPLYEHIGLYVYSDKTEEINQHLSSTIPYYNPNNQYDPQENINGRKSEWIKYRWIIEPEFKQWDKYPKSALLSLKTQNQYPLDYSYLLENYEGTHTAVRIEQTYPGLISQPIQSQIVIGENTNSEKEIQFEDGSDIDGIVNLKSYIKRSKINPANFDKGTVLANVTLTIRDSLPDHPDFRSDSYGVVKVENITYTDIGENIMPFTTQIKRKLKALSI